MVNGLSLCLLPGHLFDVMNGPFEAVLIFGVVQLVGGIFIVLIPLVMKLNKPSQTIQEEEEEEKGG